MTGIGEGATASHSAQEEGRLRDRTFGWFLLLFFLFNIGLGVFPPLLPKIMEDLQLSFAAAGLLGAAFGLFRFLVDLPTGILVGRFGAGLILHTAAALLLGGTVLSAWAPSFSAMFAARACLGAGSGMAMVFAVLYLMRRGSASNRTRRANLYEASVIAGMAISSQLGGLIGGRWGWRWSFGAATCVFALAWAVVTWGVLPGMRGLVREDARPAPEAPRERGSASAGPMLAIYLLIFGQAFAWGGGISTLLPLFGGEILRLPPQAIGRAMAVAFWVEVCLLFPVGWAADVLGKVRVALPGFLAMLVGVGLAPFATGDASYGATFICLVSGMSVWMVAPALHAERLAGGFGGRSAGLYRLVTDFGFIVAPTIVGWLIGQAGFGAAAGVIVAVLVGAIASSLWFLCSPRPVKSQKGETSSQPRRAQSERDD